MTTQSEKKEASMRALSNKKLLSVMLSSIFAAGAAAGYFVPPRDTTPDTSAHVAISAQHNSDIAALRSDIAALRERLDELLVRASRTEGKVDTLIGGGK
jgi:uncharacterized protein YceH (UPF0502 family)